MHASARKYRLPLIAMTSVCVLVALSSVAFSFEDVNMNVTAATSNDGQLVVSWSTGGFHHYNIRLSMNGGPAQQVERDGDKRFRYFGRYQRGATYTISVQGCDKQPFGRSQCTSWDTIVCKHMPCTGTEGLIDSGRAHQRR
jgi:hypothetical protein